MTVTRSQVVRSDVKGTRPAGRKKGELFVNFPDKQFGVVGNAAATIDLLSIPFHSDTADYPTGALVVKDGVIYQALAPVTAIPFAAAQWKTVGADAVVTATLAPAVALLNLGTMWFNPNTSNLYVLYLDVATKVWRQIANGLVAPSTLPPASPQVGQLWWETDSGKLYMWWDDGTSQQWVEASGGSGMSEAPVDGEPYARKDAAWVAAVRKTASNDNMVFNPGMRASQERGSVLDYTVTPYFFADQWSRELLLTAGTISIQRVDTLSPLSDAGYSTCAQAKVVAINAAPAVNNFFLFEHYVEGHRFARLKWGQADAVPGLLAFRASYPAGTWSVCVSNEALNRNFTATFTISAGQANTWVLVKIPIPAQTTGFWEFYTGKGCNITFTLVAGTDFVAAAPGWNTVSDKFCAPGCTNFALVVNDTARVTDVCLYPDPENTQTLPWFIKPTLQEELAEAERFWQRTMTHFQGATVNAQNFMAFAYLRTPMSATVPTISGVNYNALGFAAVAGALTYYGSAQGYPWTIRESRAANSTSGYNSFQTIVTANARF